MIVNEGLTAPLETKKLESTIYGIQIVCLAIRDLIVGRNFHPLLLSLNIVLQIQDLLQFKKDFAK